MKSPKLSRHQISVPLATQVTACHCGPASLQMLLSSIKVNTSQEEVVKAGKIQRRIKKYGMRPDMMATAIRTLAPRHTLWFKQHATLRDIANLIETYHCPIGINWQGLFYGSVREEKEKDPHGEHGHYSVIIDIDPAHKKIAILDPYRSFASGPRIFSYRWFLKRWWDFVMEPNKNTGKPKRFDTQRLLFILTPKNATFPKNLGLEPAEKLYELFS